MTGSKLGGTTMCKSDILYNKQDYIKWMFGCNFWTNKNYKPTSSDLPYENEYPCIAVGMTAQNYRGRDENYIEIVSLKDFASATLYEVKQIKDGSIPGFTITKDVGIFTSLEEVNYATAYRDDDEKFQTTEIKLNEENKE